MKNRNKDWRKVPTQQDREAVRIRAEHRKKREDQRNSTQDDEAYNENY